MSRSDDDLVNAAATCDSDAARELAFRRSLRGARGRRALAERRRGRSRRSRRSALSVTVGLLLLSTTALAGGTGGAVAKVFSEETIGAVQARLGIEADGVIGRQTQRAVRRFQRRNDLKADGLLGPKTLSALGIDPDSLRVVSASFDVRLDDIAECESDGDPKAVSRDGRYYGKYQFSRSTWRSIGGRGNPARASEGEQDRRAAALMSRDGTKPWPNCA